MIQAFRLFLPRDAMHKRCLCRRAVSVCPSVCLCVCPKRSCILSKWINISSKFFTIVKPHHSCFFLYQTLSQYSDGDPVIWQKSPFSTNIWLWHRSLLDRRVSTFRRWSIDYSTYASSVSRDQQMPPRHASVNLVYDRKLRRYAKDNRTEFNCMYW